jgi:hypothetical protein
MPRDVFWTLVQYLRFVEPGWVKFQHFFLPTERRVFQEIEGIAEESNVLNSPLSN